MASKKVSADLQLFQQRGWQACKGGDDRGWHQVLRG